MHALRHSVALAALVALAGVDAGAQAPPSLRQRVPSQAAARAGLDPSAGTLDSPFLLPQAPADRKQPMVAGALSFIVPGVGSFYAGAPGHGALHLVIALAAVTGIVVGGTDCVLEAMAGEDCNEGVVNAALVVYFGNWAWSIFTAVSDAKAYNSRK